MAKIASPTTEPVGLGVVSTRALVNELDARGFISMPRGQLQLAVDSALAATPPGMARMEPETAETIGQIVGHDFPALVSEHGRTLRMLTEAERRAVTAERELDALVTGVAESIMRGSEED